MARRKTSITLSDDEYLVFAQLRARYGASMSAAISAYQRLTDDPFRELQRREAQAVEHVDAPEVQEAEHAA
jgi:hypothetical protein